MAFCFGGYFGGLVGQFPVFRIDPRRGSLDVLSLIIISLNRSLTKFETTIYCIPYAETTTYCVLSFTLTFNLCRLYKIRAKFWQFGSG